MAESFATPDTAVNTEKETSRQAARQMTWVWGVLLAGVLLVGAYLRFSGINWDEDFHLHPDERFLTMVASSMQLEDSLSDYFNTSVSSMNPHNFGYGFYVYGTLPVFIVRWVAEAVDMTGYGQVHLVGRFLSGLADLGTILLAFMIALRLFRRYRLALLAAAFLAVSVLQIQISHYWTVDNIANFFTYLAFYFAVVILTGEEAPVEIEPDGQTDLLRNWSEIAAYILFGVTFGMAMASKVSIAPAALLLPAAALLRFLRLTPEERVQKWSIYLRNLVLGGLVAFLVFRIFQPYTFSGPGFFNIGINEAWLEDMSQLSTDSSGLGASPPAWQWARRPVTFAFQNMVQWGLGLPLGLLAWAGFVWMGFRTLLKGEWRQNALIWGWTLIFFTWQSLAFTSSMRYMLPVYPSLAIIAAWAVSQLWERKPADNRDAPGRPQAWRRPAAVLLGVGVLAATTAYAFAFNQIYQRPITRIEASQWIYQNVPGAINLKIETPDEGLYSQPLAYRQGLTVSAEEPLVMAFDVQHAGSLDSIYFDFIVDLNSQAEPKTLVAAISRQPDASEAITRGYLEQGFLMEGDLRGSSYKLLLNPGLNVKAGERYYLTLQLAGATHSLRLSGGMALGITTGGETLRQELPQAVNALRSDQPFQIMFNARKSGELREISLPHIVDLEAVTEEKSVQLTLSGNFAGGDGVIQAQLQDEFLPGADPRGAEYTFQLDQPARLQEGETYTLNLQLTDGPGTLAVYGVTHSIETEWDDQLPYGLDGYSPFDYETGLYRSQYLMDVYPEDDQAKYERYITGLNRADYLFFSSGRQWGTITRVPERYPLTAALYRNLLGCPEDQEIVWCYRVAQPGDFESKLGFELIQVFQSEPEVGPFTFNTQFAEEAFSVYDHPKVMIFKKTADYDPEQVRALLGAVDLNQVIRNLRPIDIPAREGVLTQAVDAPDEKDQLMLPEERLSQQRAGGTWSELFNVDALQNRVPGAGVALWYLAVTLLGWVVYPFVRMALRWLPDRGYPVVRIAGILISAYLVWLLGSLGVPFTRTTISLVLLGLVLVNVLLFYLQRGEILAELRQRGRYILIVEAVALTAFLLFLAVRLGNPDLWHQYKGGEKPMDFSYFNAVLKSTTFPPYDPWFAGGYINYYYYGFVLAGVLVKWLGIVPSIAYNILLPGWFSMLALAAFSFGWNVLHRDHPDEQEAGVPRRALWAGLASSIGLLVLGNLGTLRMIWRGFQRLAAPGPIEDGNLIQHWLWFFQGIPRFIGGQNFPYDIGSWYWDPSRVYPAPDPAITEFPFFTFLYADPHAHLWALPVTVLALLLGLSILKGRWRWGGEDNRHSWLYFVSMMVLGGITIGALRPTNTWDLPTYLVLGGVALLYAALRNGSGKWWLRAAIGAGAAGALVLLSFLLYQPYADWYQQGYNAFDLETQRATFWSYLTHWGLFLFVIAAWLFWEVREWMASTPLSSLNKLKPYRHAIYAALALFLAVFVGLLLIKISIAWVALPLAAVAAVLILRPGQPDSKRAVLFMIGSGLFLTLFVDAVVLEGAGRMNTVFKFYMQAWTLLSLSAAAALIWLLPAVEREWLPGWRNIWQAFLIFLIAGSAMYPILAGSAKIQDRMSKRAPHAVDGMAYMQYAEYADFDAVMDLSQDYNAIRWLQENVQGSPVIVEGHVSEYRWGSRYTIYTGLPGVVGWNWHQRQQRGVAGVDQWVTQRVDEIGSFYNTDSAEQAVDFLERYDVRYIIVGQMERAMYDPIGIAKFMQYEGELWHEAYSDGQTVIYEVNGQPR